MTRLIRDLYTGSRFYLAGSVIVLLFTAGFFSDYILLVARISLLAFTVAVICDLWLLFFTGRDLVLLVREIPERFSNGDNNSVSVCIKNNHFFPLSAGIVDEIPVQFQIRDFSMQVFLKPQEEKTIRYMLKPVRRGDYSFGTTNVYVSDIIGLLRRRCTFNINPVTVRVYPSFLNIRKFEFLAVTSRFSEAGLKRVRRVGLHSEFDQIRDYVTGDDLRSLNWKATAKRGKLMANQYQDERSQQVFSLIDMGRVMEMSFQNMSLLDYAINSSLVLSNIAVLKHDRAGLVTFNRKIGTFLPAENRSNTISRMLEVLYSQETDFPESNYELLFVGIRRMITHRSLLVLYTNFETLSSMLRQLPFFQRVARNHLLLVVVFENSEITALARQAAGTLEEIYTQTIAEKFVHDKNLIVRELNNHGILSVLTKPQDLSVSLINKYLELKERNLI